ncbi:MAG: metallophosphoesterase [Hyphomicrobiales bacterium]|nr:metallophosphoesterase [Hyphomicrobiales bacterium]
MEGEEHRLPDAPLPTLFHYDDERPVFFGHYWLNGTPNLGGRRAACLDYSVAKGGELLAYRWSGEPILSDANIVSVSSHG